MGLPAGGLLDKGYFKHLILVGTIIYVFRFHQRYPIASFSSKMQSFHAFFGTCRELLLNFSVSRCGDGNRRGPDLFTSYGRPGSSLEGSESVRDGNCHNRCAYHLYSLAKYFKNAGSSFGGIVYPILLNNLFNSSVGFAWGVRASGFLTLAMLGGANCLMSAKPKGDATGLPKAKLRDILTDTPFMLAVAG